MRSQILGDPINNSNQSQVQPYPLIIPFPFSFILNELIAVMANVEDIGIPDGKLDDKDTHLKIANEVFLR